MKKRLLLILLSFFILNKVNAQTNVYHPFPDSISLWNETSYYTCCATIVFNPQVEFLGGDTVISTRHYKKILATGYQYAQNTTCCNYINSYKGAMRQDTAHKKVYLCLPTDTTDVLLYDFNLQVGDTLPPTYINAGHLAYVTSISSVLIGTTYRKKYNMSGFSYIEGIGSTQGLLYQKNDDGGSDLNCFSQNHVTLYPSITDSCSSTVSIKAIKNNLASNIVIYPNPAQNNFTIQTNTNDKQTLQVFDVNGKLVLTQTINGTINIDASTLAQGVYNVSVTNNEGVVNKRLVIVR